MSAIIGTTQYIDYFNDPHGVTQGAIGSALAAGSVVSALFAGPLSDKVGRRDAIFLGKDTGGPLRRVGLTDILSLPLVASWYCYPGCLQRVRNAYSRPHPEWRLCRHHFLPGPGLPGRDS